MLTDERLPWELDEGDSVQAEIVPSGELTRSMEKQLEELKEIEDDLFKKSMRVMNASLDFMDVDLQNPQAVLEKWTSEVGEEEAQARLRVALANWSSVKEAPVGIKTAKDMAVAMVKARATRDSAPVRLNMTLVKMTAPADILAALDVGEST